MYPHLKLNSIQKSFDLERTQEFAVALVGAPNSGKTSLFNWLTGSKYKTVNYPGATVEYSLGSLNKRYSHFGIQIMDTPGIYSLSAKSPDEEITCRAIYEHQKLGPSPLVISVVDATRMSRQLLITEQLKRAGFNVILVVTMVDILSKESKEIDAQKLSRELQLPVILVDARLGGGILELVKEMNEQLKNINKISLNDFNWTPQDSIDTQKKMKKLEASVLVHRENSRPKAKSTYQKTKELDQILLHPVFGILLFILMMGSLFTGIFWLAKPLMQLVSDAFGLLSEQVRLYVHHPLISSFLSDGVLASLGSVFSFVPQIFILFLGIVAFEDSGYLARAASLIDKPFYKIGLNGRSFVPLLSAYACAVPAMMAARTMNSKKERWITLFIIPLMSCSARLPVYSLLLSFLFINKPAYFAGLFLTAIYFMSLIIGALVATIVNRFIPEESQSLFMMELPLYRTPKLKNVMLAAAQRTLSYVQRAGPMIFVFALVIWIATTFPNFNEENKEQRLTASYAAQAGKLIEPIMKPMGGDWRTGVSLISAFAAREVFVSSLAVVLGITEDAKPNESDTENQNAVASIEEHSLQNQLVQRMSEAKTSSDEPLFNFASVCALIVFFMIALQCLSTTSMAARESGNMKFALLQLVSFNLLAYLVAVIVFQVLKS